MPRIENDIKLDFKDVLLRPKRSTLKSRSEVSVHHWMNVLPPNNLSTNVMNDPPSEVGSL